MRLETEMQDGCVHALGYCVDADSVKPLEVARMEHDAAAAHALMQSMHAWFSPGQLACIAGIEAGADAIMTEWGFKE